MKDNKMLKIEYIKKKEIKKNLSLQFLLIHILKKKEEKTS